MAVDCRTYNWRVRNEAALICKVTMDFKYLKDFLAMKLLLLNNNVRSSTNYSRITMNELTCAKAVHVMAQSAAGGRTTVAAAVTANNE